MSTLKKEERLSPQVVARLKRLRVLARLLDEAVEIPGTNFRFGLDSIIGLVPVAGDVLTSLVSMFIVREAAAMGVPKETLIRMLMNVGLDLAAGSVPVLGDIFDVAWKANSKNLKLLEKFLELKADRERGPVIDV